MRKILSALLALVFAAASAQAWNNVGHRTIAELVWRQMNKAERQSASDLLRQHPHYKKLLTAEVPRGVSKEEWAFISAAVWPDWTRPAKPGQSHKPESITKHDVYPHAIGYPFLRAGETNRALLENFYIAKPNAEMAVSISLETLRNRQASAHDRAVALCWVLHLIGDLHQPLHAANRVTKEKPRGEGLGGDFIVLGLDKKSINLHSFWDQLPGVDPSYQAIAKLANELASTPELQPPARLEEYRENKTLAAWVQESFRLAVDFAYAENRVQFVYQDDLASGKVADSAIPAVKSDYVTAARRIAHRRLVLAAQRLTDELKGGW